MYPRANRIRSSRENDPFRLSHWKFTSEGFNASNPRLALPWKHQPDRENLEPIESMRRRKKTIAIVRTSWQESHFAHDQLWQNPRGIRRTYIRRTSFRSISHRSLNRRMERKWSISPNEFSILFWWSWGFSRTWHEENRGSNEALPTRSGERPLSMFFCSSPGSHNGDQRERRSCRSFASMSLKCVALSRFEFRSENFRRRASE